jgi:hypothetical protein
MKGLWYFVGVFLIVFGAMPRGSLGQVQQRTRTKNHIDSIGGFRLEYRMPLREHQKTVAKMEEFIWSHWERREPCELTYRFVTAEGVPVDFSMFVERDEQEVWRVRIERKETRTGGPPSNWSIFSRTEFAYSIQRLDGEKPTDDGYAPFPDDQVLRPGTYLLQFREKDGNGIGRWEPNNTTR